MSVELERILNLLAERFGTTIEHLYAVMIRQAYIEAAYSLIEMVIMVVFIYYFIARLHGKLREMLKSEDADIAIYGGICLIFGWIAVIVAFIATIYDFRTVLGAALNPEYWVLQQILGMFGG